jgi:hypothetical protein
MPFVDLSSLAESHVARLNWFAERAGTTTRWPAPLLGNLFLVTRPKGILKPRDLEVALSIRIQLESLYPDGEIFPRDDGTWYFAYHQENPDPVQRDDEYTNRAVMRCIDERVPLGVMRERLPDKQNSDTYDVLGLGMPVKWEAGYFFVEGVRADGYFHVGDTGTDLMFSEAERGASDMANAQPPTDDYDARVRTTRQIVARRGQPKFRAGLLEAYHGRCAITGSDTQAVLEAAHIRPYRGPESNVLTNGLLLRADVHTLFDLAQLGIEPSSHTVRLAMSLKGSSYDYLDGTQLSLPSDPQCRPSMQSLESAWNHFIEAEAARAESGKDA